jgi:hypothetical protein
MIKKNRRSQLVYRLLDRLKHVVSSMTEDKASHLGKLVDDLKTTFSKSFSYPTPCFSTVFGESRFTVIGPYGQVRYPIIFEWRPHENACEYVLRIDELNIAYRTTETKLIVEAGTWEFVAGEEYMWELVVHGEDEILTEEYGFFSLVGEEALRDIQHAEAAFWSHYRWHGKDPSNGWPVGEKQLLHGGSRSIHHSLRTGTVGRDRLSDRLLL